jgi:KAP family P-loop domain
MSEATSRILLDVPSKNPELGFPETADALASIIEESDPQFAIGIFGGWGSGKTTLMRAIEERLSDKKRDSSKRIVPVQFSAWRYEKEQHLIVPLLDTVRERLISWSEEQETEAGKRVATRTASTIGKAMNAFVSGFSMNIGVPGALQVSYDANKTLERVTRMRADQRAARVPRSFYHASFRALEQSFEEFVGQEGGRRIVVFVDDLDRCLPEGALEVLESMKLFFDIPGFVFVVGLDRVVVEYIVDQKYRRDDNPVRYVMPNQQNGAAPRPEDAEPVRLGETAPISGTDYIKKIFQVPFTLAPVSAGQLEEFLGAVYDDGGLTTTQQDEIRDTVADHLQYLVRGSGVNPREIKRYINAYTLQRMIKADLDANAMLTLQTIDFQPDWEPVREAFYTYRELFTQALNAQVAGGVSTALEDLDPELGAMPDDFIEYVSPTAPGNALLQQHSLDEYIYSGAATRSYEDTRLLDSIRNIGELHRGLRELAQTGSSDTMARTNVKAQASSLRSSLEPSIRGPLAPLINRDLESLLLALDAPETQGAVKPEDLPGWFRESERLVRQIRRRLLDVYRASSAGVAAS